MAAGEKQIVVEIDLTRVAAAVVAAGLLAVLLWTFSSVPGVAVAEVTPATAATLAAAAAAPRQFYLTQTTFMGDQTLTACAPGYHMASLWEILDPSELAYNTSLGYTSGDSGQGPATGARGRIRTGGISISGGGAGTANCKAWTSSSSSDYGTTAWLPSDWDTQPPMFVWNAESSFSSRCDSPERVWCVED
jgi:hypothetical protein